MSRTFRAANAARTREAAAATCDLVADALDELGPDTPTPLLEAGRLRLAHPDASLTELAQRASPPATKDAIASRLRRLLALAARSTK